MSFIPEILEKPFLTQIQVLKNWLIDHDFHAGRRRQHFFGTTF